MISERRCEIPSNFQDINIFSLERICCSSFPLSFAASCLVTAASQHDNPIRAQLKRGSN